MGHVVMYVAEYIATSYKLQLPAPSPRSGVSAPLPLFPLSLVLPEQWGAREYFTFVRKYIVDR